MRSVSRRLRHAWLSCCRYAQLFSQFVKNPSDSVAAIECCPLQLMSLFFTSCQLLGQPASKLLAIRIGGAAAFIMHGCQVGLAPSGGLAPVDRWGPAYELLIVRCERLQCPQARSTCGAVALDATRHAASQLPNNSCSVLAHCMFDHVAYLHLPGNLCGIERTCRYMFVCSTYPQAEASDTKQ